MQVDPEPEALRQAAGNAGDRMLLQVQGDPAGWAAAMAERLAGCSLDAGWRATVDAAVAYRPAEWRGIGSDSPVPPAQLGYAVHDFLAGSADSVFVSDGGEIGQWAQACVNAPIGSSTARPVRSDRRCRSRLRRARCFRRRAS